MKYTALIALLGMASAKHHHHHHHKSLAQINGVNVPLPYGSSDKSFVPAKAAAAAVVAKQQATEAANVASITTSHANAAASTHAKKSHVTQARIDQVDNEVYQNPYYTRRQWTQRPPPALAQMEDEFLNAQDAALQAGRKESESVVATQQATEAENVNSVESQFTAADAEAKKTAAEVRAERIQQQAGGVNHSPYPSVNLQIADNEADKSYQQWRKQAAATVAKQQATEATKTSEIAAANAKDIADTNAEKNRVTSKHRAAMKVYQPWMMVYIPEEQVYLHMI